MTILSINKAKENLDEILNEIQNSYEPMFITSEKNSAVLISEEVWRSIEETLFLTSIPGMKDSIINGIKENIENCASSVEW